MPKVHTSKSRKRRSQRELDDEFFYQQRVLMQDFLQKQSEIEEAAAAKRQEELKAILDTFKTCIQAVATAPAQAPFLVPQMWNMPSTPNYIPNTNKTDTDELTKNQKP